MPNAQPDAKADTEGSYDGRPSNKAQVNNETGAKVFDDPELEKLSLALVMGQHQPKPAKINGDKFEKSESGSGSDNGSDGDKSEDEGDQHANQQQQQQQ